MGSRNDTKACIVHGPWGGPQGKEWVYMPEGFIRKIHVQHDNIVRSIKFETFNSLGETQASFFGGTAVNRTDTISIDYPDEYLISICGTIKSYDGYNGSFDFVFSICFITNKNRYGPYGLADHGTAFSYDGKGGVIVGFHGRTVDNHLTSIGVYVMPESLAFSQSPTYEGKIVDELCASMSKMTMPRDPGPWGVDGGKPWDDGVFHSIKQVRIYLGDVIVLYAVQFGYLRKDAKFVVSPVRGETGASRIEVVNLDSKNEYLTGISGSYFYEYGEEHYGVTSISFHTDKNVHGPYGKKLGTQFTSLISASPFSPSLGKVVGFHGRSTNGFLTKIGVHMEYF